MNKRGWKKVGKCLFVAGRRGHLNKIVGSCFIEAAKPGVTKRDRRRWKGIAEGILRIMPDEYRGMA